MNRAAPTDKTVEPSMQPPLGSIERRAMLLKTMGKGSAVLAAASLPIHTLANTPTIVIQGVKDKDGRAVRCSISGMHSGLGSRMPATDTCTGKSPGYWHKPEHWTAAQSDLINLADPTNSPTFATWFGPASSTRLGNATLYQYLTSIGGGSNNKLRLNNTDEWHWVCAWMNAMASDVSGTGVVNFPYSGPQIVQLYRNPTAFNTTRAGAIAFLKLIEGTAG